MVKLGRFLKSVRNVYMKALGKNICLLIVGGSIGRENYIEGWSDADLFLVLRKPDSKSLRLVKESEEYIRKHFNIEVDTMITSKFTIEHTAPEKLHGKIKNFLFFLPKEKTLIQRHIELPEVDRQKFGYGFWATYAEQEKNFLRRNADINPSDRQVLQGLAKKNVKIIFLILKQFLAGSSSPPSTYKEVLSSGKEVLPTSIFNKLKRYEEMRTNNKLPAMSKAQLKKIIPESIQIFNELGKLIIKKHKHHEKRD